MRLRQHFCRPGMTSLQAVILLGAGFLVVWGLMELFEGSKGATNGNVALTMRGEFKRPQGDGAGGGAGGGGRGDPRVPPVERPPGEGGEAGAGDETDQGSGKGAGGEDVEPAQHPFLKGLMKIMEPKESDARDVTVEVLLYIAERHTALLDPALARQAKERIGKLGGGAKAALALIDMIEAIKSNDDEKILAEVLKFGIEVATRKLPANGLLDRVLGNYWKARVAEVTAYLANHVTDAVTARVGPYIWEVFDSWLPGVRQGVIDLRRRQGLLPPRAEDDPK